MEFKYEPIEKAEPSKLVKVVMRVKDGKEITKEIIEHKRYFTFANHHKIDNELLYIWSWKHPVTGKWHGWSGKDGDNPTHFLTIDGSKSFPPLPEDLDEELDPACAYTGDTEGCESYS